MAGTPASRHRLGSRVRRNLTDPTFQLPGVRVDIGTTSLAGIATSLDAPLQDLGLSVHGVDLGTQSSNAALAKKERRLLDEQQQAILAGKVLEALTAYAGHPEVAKRIRLSRHRARDEQETPEAAQEPAAQPPEPTNEAPTTDSTADSEAPDADAPDAEEPVAEVDS
ncbi:MAG: hypothetical protein GY719_09965 [bacterium]|nr:hypothetical protein [bacterium]